MSARPAGYWAQYLPQLTHAVALHRLPNGAVNWPAVAQTIPGTTATACRQKWDSLQREPPATTSAPHSLTEPFQYLPAPPPLTAPPFAVPVPACATATDPQGMVAVVFGDTHFGAEDPKALAVALAITRDACPDVVLHVGDCLDAYWLSRFDKDTDNVTRLQDEIDRARVFLHQVAQVAPQARRVLLEGNHCRRLAKAIWGMPGTAAEIAKLTAFRESITWPKLLQLDAIGWEWVPERDQTRTGILPGFITKHGTVVRKWSAMSGRGEWERYGLSGVSGHCHRLGVFYHRDHNGSHCWVETGCLCGLNPEYVMDPDWHQGLLVITWSEDGTRFNVEPIYIQQGRAVWRGREYVA